MRCFFIYNCSVQQCPEHFVAEGEEPASFREEPFIMIFILFRPLVHPPLYRGALSRLSKRMSHQEGFVFRGVRNPFCAAFLARG